MLSADDARALMPGTTMENVLKDLDERIRVAIENDRQHVLLTDHHVRGLSRSITTILAKGGTMQSGAPFTRELFDRLCKLGYSLHFVTPEAKFSRPGELTTAYVEVSW